MLSHSLRNRCPMMESSGSARTYTNIKIGGKITILYLFPKKKSYFFSSFLSQFTFSCYICTAKHTYL